MTLVKELEKCPLCKEPIESGAVRCKHCHADLTELGQKKSVWAKYNCFRTGFLFGILFAVVVFLLAYLHFFSTK